MAILILCAGEDPEPWVLSLREQDPNCDIRVWPNVGHPRDVLLALVWNHPRGELARYPNLRCIASMGAGVDHILSDPALPRGVPITKVVDKSLTSSMVEYVVLSVLDFSRDMQKYRADQRERRWAPRFPRSRDQLGVGIMGLGELGGACARKLSDMGYKVLGWRRTACSLEGVATFWGRDQLGNFLAGTDVLVCLLPLTPETEGILNKETFRRLRPGAFLINVARGRHLVEEDLLEALEKGRLSGARLDVFSQEPLPSDHPFWAHPRIQLTPHISSLTEPKAVAPQILENYRRVCRSIEPLHRVDPHRGY